MTGPTECISSMPSRRTRTWIGRSPLLRTKPPIQPAVPVGGHRLIVDRQELITNLDSAGGSRRTLGDGEHRCACPVHRQRFMRERAVFAWQARHRARVQADLRPCPVFAVITIGNAQAERDVVEAGKQGEVVAKLVGLLLALLSFNLSGWQWRQLGERPAGCTDEETCNKRNSTPMHAQDPANGVDPALPRLTTQAASV